MKLTERRKPQAPYFAKPIDRIDEHHVRCPTCAQVVDTRDLDEAARHLAPGHSEVSGSDGGATGNRHRSS
jgi:hypothetical protein